MSTSFLFKSAFFPYLPSIPQKTATDTHRKKTDYHPKRITSGMNFPFDAVTMKPAPHTKRKNPNNVSLNISFIVHLSLNRVLSQKELAKYALV